MIGLADSILYVGKAKDLRTRLMSYRRAKPGQVPRKVLRLINVISHIRWEECGDEQSALLRENELLRKHRPPFNVMNKRPDTYYFVAMKTDRRAREVSFRLTMNPISDDDVLYGAYKGRSSVRQGYTSLLRLLWASQAQAALETDRFEFPMPLAARKPAYVFSLKLREAPDSPKFREWERMLKRFLHGSSAVLLEMLTLDLLANEKIPPFVYGAIQEDLEALRVFYEVGPRRNHSLRRFHKLSERLIPQEKIDDLLVTFGVKKKAG